MKQHSLEMVNSDQLFHLLYLLDTNDPLIPLSIPNARYVPLLFEGEPCVSSGGQRPS